MMVAGRNQISGPMNSATVKEADIVVCKGFVTIIDTAILPPFP
jgi:hypothetical protein